MKTKTAPVSPAAAMNKLKRVMRRTQDKLDTLQRELDREVKSLERQQPLDDFEADIQETLNFIELEAFFHNCL